MTTDGDPGRNDPMAAPMRSNSPANTRGSSGETASCAQGKRFEQARPKRRTGKAQQCDAINAPMSPSSKPSQIKGSTNVRVGGADELHDADLATPGKDRKPNRVGNDDSCHREKDDDHGDSNAT